MRERTGRGGLGRGFLPRITIRGRLCTGMTVDKRKSLSACSGLLILAIDLPIMSARLVEVWQHDNQLLGGDRWPL